MAEQASLTQKLAAFAAALDYDALPADVRADLADRLAKNRDMHVQPAQRPCYDETRAATFIEA